MATTIPAAEARPWSSDDMLLLFTDGVSDARNKEGVRLGEERVVELARNCTRAEPAELLKRILELHDQHTGDARQRDDLTIVALRS